LVFAYRWGAQKGPGDKAYEPSLGAILATMRGRVVGVRPVRVD
jgi:hypothetical protein